ncbi:MAG: glycerate kinase [Planctomycetota bacterium]
MKIIIAPNAFKECLPAEKVALAVARGLRRIFPLVRFHSRPAVQLEQIPISDGGDGFLSILTALTRGQVFSKKVCGPLGAKRHYAQFGFLGKNCASGFVKGRTAVIEIAEAAGLRLFPPAQRKPLLTHTYGIGELIKSALDKKTTRIIVGLGGSVTADGGCGMACALGVKFLDRNGKSFVPTGGSLHQIDRFDLSNLDRRVKKVQIIGACDVTNPLLGPHGAARTFGPQKGASPEEVKILENNLRHLAQIIRRELGINVSGLKGGGSAGGLAAGLSAFLNARLVSGAELFFKIINLRKKLAGARLVITGEGKLDKTTLFGKAPFRVAQKIKEYNPDIPVIAIAGKLGAGYRKLLSAGIDACFSISPPGMSEKESIKNAEWLIEKQIGKIIRSFNMPIGHSFLI